MVTVPEGIQNPAYRPLSAHLLYPESRKLRAADWGLRFRSSSGATLGGVNTTCRGNGKALTNLLYTHRARCLRRHGGQDREAPGSDLVRWWPIDGIPEQAPAVKR